MRCQYHSNKPCDDCDEFLSSCSKCKHIDNLGECDNSSSKYYGECVDGFAVCCCLYEETE